MTPAEFRNTRKSLGLTQAKLAACLDVSARFVRMMEAGEYDVSERTARLMRWWAKHGIPDDWMEKE